MRIRVQKWGHSLAVRIPKSLAAEARLYDNTVVDLAVVAGKLIVAPQPERVSLEQLLAGVTRANRHHEIDFGGPVGEEVW